MAYRRLKLPHLHPVGATFSVVLLVHDAVPKNLVLQLNRLRLEKLAIIRTVKLPGWEIQLAKAQAHYDERFNDLLRRYATQRHPLSHPAAAQIVVDKLKQYHGSFYDLCAYSVMSNHVHAELDFSVQLPENWDRLTPPPSYQNLAEVVRVIKGGSAYAINAHFGTAGAPVWMNRYRDRFIRNEEHLASACRYTLRNPVAAGLVKDTCEDPFTGGMSEEELALRASRRVYPAEGLWLQRLGSFDEGQAKYFERVRGELGREV